jgi:2-(1,2-epoxy-1,2-dihydrophenyl)acetyl-CoA isomerase
MSFYQQNFDDLIAEHKGNILKITLNNPKMKNAISDQMISSLVEVLGYADSDNDVRAIILTGKGNCFCAGGDIKAMENKTGMFAGEPFELRNRYSHGIQKIPRVIESLQKPLIAAVNGAAIGAGCDLTAMCDLRIASESARFAETFTKLALVPGDGGPYFLARVIGYAKAMEMYLTGDIYDAKQALAMGLVSNVVSDEELLPHTMNIAEKIASNAPSAVQLTKLAMKRALKDDLNSHLDMMSAYQGISQRTQDHFEALDAFNNKRQPNFKGE